MTWIAYLATGAIAFALGSIPFGLIIGKLVYHMDIRNVGSGNIGTTNAMRAMGFRGGAVVFILDFGKGLLSGLIALATSNAALGQVPTLDFPCQLDFLAIAFFMCTAGHIYSPWLNFKGGKGIAVAVGCMFIAYGPLWALIELGLFAVIVIATRYVSAGSIAAAVLCVILGVVLYFGHPVAMIFGAGTGAIVAWAHRGNFERLLAGTERRVGQKKGSQLGSTDSAKGPDA